MAKKTTAKVVKKPKAKTVKNGVSVNTASERVEPNIKTDVVSEGKQFFSGTSGSISNMMFSKVSSISTPYGNVTKITRKSDGKDLWNGGGSVIRNLSACTMTLDPLSVYYDGTAQTVDVTISHDEWGTLVSGTDYSVSYSNNTNVGTATVTASGIGNYTGQKTGKFQILPPYKFYQKSDQFMSDLKTLDTTKLPKIGDTIVFKEWAEGDNYYDIVGYDVNVPEYVGYMNGSDVIYVRVWDDTTNNTRSVAVGDKTYSRSFSTGNTYSTFTDTNKTVGSISGTFSYGNLNPFSVPATITVGGKTYAFCGHTATVLSKKIITDSIFGDNNVWKTSTLRSLVSDNFGWERQEVLLRNMLKSCNITWDMNKTDGNGNTLDQFFIPSHVELGHTDTELKDNTHSKFKKSDTEYLDDDFRAKGNYWRSRSQMIYFNSSIWSVKANGDIKVSGPIRNQYGVVPACVIG